MTPEPLSCSYRNGTDRMVILRCSGPGTFYLERVIFPFELLSFECPPGAELEIWTHGLGGPELIDSIAAKDLSIQVMLDREPWATPVEAHA